MKLLAALFVSILTSFNASAQDTTHFGPEVISVTQYANLMPPVNVRMRPETIIEIKVTTCAIMRPDQFDVSMTNFLNRGADLVVSLKHNVYDCMGPAITRSLKIESYEFPIIDVVRVLRAGQVVPLKVTHNFVY